MSRKKYFHWNVCMHFVSADRNLTYVTYCWPLHPVGRGNGPGNAHLGRFGSYWQSTHSVVKGGEQAVPWYKYRKSNENSSEWMKGWMNYDHYCELLLWFDLNNYTSNVQLRSHVWSSLLTCVILSLFFTMRGRWMCFMTWNTEYTEQQ